MPGDARREAEGPPWFAVIGTITLAPLFAGSVIVLGPYLLSGWKLDAPFFGWAPSSWIGGALVIARTPQERPAALEAPGRPRDAVEPGRAGVNKPGPRPSQRCRRSTHRRQKAQAPS